ncbi:DUF4123 domain-containing protein [Cystobacter ferrugineus]|nr:DUF4123 domain-containing protein [Cystobacter ferrugineus]
MTTFSVYHEAEARGARLTGPMPAENPTHKTQVLAALQTTAEPLFAILDASVDSRILVLLRESTEECRSLYEGASGDLLEEVAPYLVALQKDSSLLEVLVHEGWGRHWGIFLTSPRPFHEVRRHFRKFLMIEDDKARKLYFRFYDPRVLRQFLPLCNPSQTESLFEAVSAYLLEEADPLTSLVRFTRHEHTVLLETLGPGAE